MTGYINDEVEDDSDLDAPYQKDEKGVLFSIKRELDSIKCICGGYAERVDCTTEELELYNCGRPYECCARAFQCCVCKKRYVGNAQAPDMDNF